MTKDDFERAATPPPKPNMPDLFRDVHDLSGHEKRSAELLNSVLERTAALATYSPIDAQLALSRVVRAIEWEQQYNDIATPLIIDVYTAVLRHGRDASVSRALGNILAYGRQHYSEEEKVIGAAIDSLSALAQRTHHHNASLYTNAVRRTMDHAAASRRQDLIEHAFCKMWASIGDLGPDMGTTAHSVIWDSYGVAQRHKAFEAYIEGGKTALFAPRKENSDFAYGALIREAIASAAYHQRTGHMKLDF